MSKKYRVGVDLGGTNIAVGVIDENYNIIGRGKLKTNVPRPAEEIMADIVNGVKMIIDGKKSLEVLKKGHQESGRILDLTETEVTENNNGNVSRYMIYNLKFEYTDDFGNLCESQEQISQNIYEKLKQMTLVPILVYKERAVFDKKKFDIENN